MNNDDKKRHHEMESWFSLSFKNFYVADIDDFATQDSKRWITTNSQKKITLLACQFQIK